MSDMKDVDATNFDAEVVNSDTPVLVDFWAPWCNPCKMMAPTVDRLAERYAGKVKVVKLNVDDSPDIANRFGIRGIPSLFIFKGGAVLTRLVGVQTEAAMASALDAAI
jgi:thioredoxin 1